MDADPCVKGVKRGIGLVKTAAKGEAYDQGSARGRGGCEEGAARNGGPAFDGAGLGFVLTSASPRQRGG
jgi:hypothetical protein